MLEVRGVHKRYGEVEALRGVDLDVDPGQIVSLLGRNGAGKTTLLSVVAGLVAADQGSVHLDGIDVLADRSKAAGLLGIAPQETGIYPVLTVRENLEFFCDLSAVDRGLRRQRATEVAERLGLTDLLDRKGTQLSGGEARRLHTACALVHQPRLLMLDEPTVGADVATRRQLIEAVRAMAAEGAGVIYTTHYLPEVEALDADIVIIDDGKILARGRRHELIDQHHLGGLRFTVRTAPDGGTDDQLLAGLELASTRRSNDGAQTEYLAVGEATMAELVRRFGDQIDRLVAVERNLPDLESVFLTVTGHDLDGDGDGAADGAQSGAQGGADGGGA